VHSLNNEHIVQHHFGAHSELHNNRSSLQDCWHADLNGGLNMLVVNEKGIPECKTLIIM